MMQLGIIGTGNMAEAIIAGLLNKKVLRPSQIVGFDVKTSRLRFIKKKYKIATAPSLTELAKKTETILLAVKPQQFGELLSEINPLLKSRHLLLSIAAGIDTAFIQKRLGNPQKRQKIIRLMPNTPAMVGLGATAFYANRFCTKNDRQLTRKLFEAVGIVFEIKQENLLNAVTALSGSGPAFVYLFAEALAVAGNKIGLPREMALALTIQTLLGAAQMMKQSVLPPSTLIQKVASKGGTTEAGLKVLQAGKFDSRIKAALKAAARRAKQLCHS